MIKLMPPRPPRVNVSRRIKRWRKHNGLTQKEGAKILQVSVRTIQDYEQGRRGHGVSYFWYNKLIEITKIERPNKKEKKPRAKTK